jgi:tRNA(fMet)-specific endonuclease VapC
MFVLDTDTFTHFLRAHVRVTARVGESDREVVLTEITQIEQLQGRFASVLKAEDGDKLLQAQQWLQDSRVDLNRFTILPIEGAAADEFDRLLSRKELRRIGRADLLIAAITLARKATLVTRNLKHFQKVPRLSIENWVD